MNSTIKHQLNHRSIREFKEEAVPEEVVDTLLDVANHTATSTGMQSYSIIRVLDPAKRKAITEVCGQEYVGRAPELWIFIVDVFRNSRIAREQGVHLESERDTDRFFQGFTDAVLAAQNVTNAIESLDMGAVFLGSILNDTRKMIEILDLPELTFPALGIIFGTPNQEPQLKPRMPKELKFFTDSYHIYEDYMKEIEDYDQVMRTYYDLRDANRRVDYFSKQVVTRLEDTISGRQELAQVIVEQGFDLNLD